MNAPCGASLTASSFALPCVIELRQRGLKVEQQVVYPLFYDGQTAGAYIADVVVENKTDDTH